ncbi:MAG: polyphenol oxidase family protein [Candidatus Saccharimonadaceae bacterium]
MGVFVATSYVSDGTMSDRINPNNPALITNRTTWLSSQGLAIEDTVRVKITYNEPELDHCRYREVGAADSGVGMFDSNIQPADALVTKEKNLALFLPVADCVATTLYDEEKGILMLTHLGRQSLEQNGGIHSVKYLQENYGVNPANLQVWLSAAAGKDTYKIYKLDNKGMKEAVYEQLLSAGVIQENITDNKDDTATDDRYFSHSAFLKGNKSTPDDGTFAMVAVMTS